MAATTVMLTPLVAHSAAAGASKLGSSTSSVRGAPVASRSVALAQKKSAGSPAVVASASKEQPNLLARAGAGLAALTLAATLQTAAVSPAVASELDILNAPVPTGYYIDDGGLLTRASQAQVNKLAGIIEKETGYKVIVVTTRKLAIDPDPFAFADKVLEKWYPTRELGDKKAVLLVVKTSKEGALAAGPGFSKALGDLIESISTDNIPVYAEQEKFNEAISSSLTRIDAKLRGKADPGAPGVAKAQVGSNFKSKEETEGKKGTYITVVGGLLVIAFVVPMVQYYGYIQKGNR